jgi:hypothetical protein
MSLTALERERTTSVRVLATALLVAALPVAAVAHMSGVSPTFGSLFAGADRVVVVKVLDPARAVSVPSPNAASAAGDGATSEVPATTSVGAAHRAVVEAEITEAIVGGGAPGERIRFATHGHGVATYAPGDTALVFLDRLRDDSELGRLRSAGIEWVSLQEHDSKFVLDDPANDPRVEAARSHAKASRLPPAERQQALGTLTLSLLRSPDVGLAADAVRDLAVPRPTPWIRTDLVPALLEQVVHAPDRPISVRVALLVVLDGRGLVDAPAEWVRLLRSTKGEALAHAIRVAGRHPSPPIDTLLVEMLAREPRIAEAAALALADPRHSHAVPALETALSRDEGRVRGAAIRALGAIGSAEALAALERLSTSHPDAAVRRRAAGELRRLGATS